MQRIATLKIIRDEKKNTLNFNVAKQSTPGKMFLHILTWEGAEHVFYNSK